ncbi:MAG: carbon storage regulator [Acidobacteria bacterium]|nr:carbon storage regulator [Acidobacteriota bacterium]
MLVIRRRAGESLLIGDNVEIEILALTQSYVKLGIRAPQSVPILRKEIRQTYDQNLAASNLSSLEAVSGLVEFLRKNESESSNKSQPPR